MRISIKEVREKCNKDRYFSYDAWQDRLFVSPAIYLVWVCLRLGLSGNAVSWISAFVAIFGAFLLASDNSLIVFLGSFGYILWYLLDYVDGAVARFDGKGSVAGQYLDWVMHVISHVAIVAGISLGAINSSGTWLYPFVILGVIAACLAYARFSMAWFAICMEQQQRRAKGLDVSIESKSPPTSTIKWTGFKYIRGLAILIFHENYLIFTLPIVAGLELFQLGGPFDLRILFVVLAGTLYFSVQVLEIHSLALTKKIQRAYFELFSSDELPNLPNDHFFN